MAYVDPQSKWEWDVKYDEKRKGYSVAYKPVGVSSKWYFTQSFPVQSEEEAQQNLKEYAKMQGWKKQPDKERTKRDGLC